MKKRTIRDLTQLKVQLGIVFHEVKAGNIERQTANALAYIAQIMVAVLQAEAEAKGKGRSTGLDNLCIILNSMRREAGLEETKSATETIETTSECSEE